MGTGHLRESAWINAASGQWSFIRERTGWAKRPGNLTSIGLPDAVREVISDIPDDYFGETW